jgi:hypothetical protein
MKGDRRKDLEEFQANAAAKGIKVTASMEKRFLAWLEKIEAQEARGAAKLAAWDSKHVALLDRLGLARKEAPGA